MSDISLYYNTLYLICRVKRSERNEMTVNKTDY